MLYPNHTLEPKDEAEHLVRCPVCGGYFDLHDARQVSDHLGPLPHPAEAQPQ
jgi:C4-type Zn-finger protein